MEIIDMKDIVIYGAGGMGREAACLLRLINKNEPQWNIVGFLDDNTKLHGSSNEYGTVLGGSEWLEHRSKPIAVVIAVGSAVAVRSIAERITNPVVEFPNIIAPSVCFLDKDSLRIGKGNIICHNCLVSCNVRIGDFNLFNGYIPIGHDVTIGSFNVVMPSCNISGEVQIGDGNFFGVQSVVLQGIKIGNDTRIGANSVIIRKTKDGNLYLGNPATRMKF